MSKFLTWLHLSDLHFYEPKTGWDAARVLQTLREDLQQMQTNHQLQPDLIFFTGDAAFGHVRNETGHAIGDQFDGAHRFFDGVRTAFDSEVSRNNIFLVPGNHDINRDCITPDQTAWLDSQTDVNVVNSLIKDESRQWLRLMERLEDYHRFLERHGYNHLLTDPGRLIYTLVREIHGIKVGIAGFNSAWSCTSRVESEKGKLWMGGRWQIEHLRAGLSSVDLTVALVHHPSGWLVEYEDPDLRRRIERDFDFCVHGHEHQEWVERADSHTRIAAGACYDRSEGENGYNLVRLNLETGSGEVWLRHYHAKGGGWVPEVIPRKTNNDGLWPLNGLRQIAAAPPQIPIAEASSATPLVVDAPTPMLGLYTSRVDKANQPFLTYGSDLPPVVDAWVGREDEIAELNALKNGVIAVTGIGGQGKSTLVAKFLDAWKTQNPEGFWDWRDCREEGERFHTQLIALIEHLTKGEITGSSLAEADTRAVVRYFFELASERLGLIVLDNVDHYVNMLDNEFSMGVAMLAQEALRVQHNLLIVFTCRPRVTYASPRFQEIHLSGLELSQAVDLFRLRGVKFDQLNMQDRVAEIWSRTEGHPLWLNLIAIQISRNPENMLNILQELRKGQIDDRASSIFKAIWAGLNEHQTAILRSMAEVSHPETVDAINSFVAVKIKNYNQFNKAFKSLKTMSLTVERGSNSQGTKFDLHPLVRSYIRTEYPRREDRLPFIQQVLVYFEQFMRGSSAPVENAPLDLLERWTAKAELEIESQDLVAALKTLSATADQLIARGFHEEFFRVAMLLFDNADWVAMQSQDMKTFDSVVDDLIRSLVEHNREKDAREYLRRYELAVGKGTVAYLRLCRVACYFEWFLGNYSHAITWGQNGVELKKNSDVDTNVDVEYTLALALRDSGRWDDALKTFAPSRTVEEILNDNHFNSGKDANFYGNVGRCLQLKGQVVDALRCYIKSAELLEDRSSAQSVLNKGYASLWIGEALEILKDFDTAYLFYKRAIIVWVKRAPLRVAEPKRKMWEIQHLVNAGFESLSDSTIEVRCKKWIKNY